MTSQLQQFRKLHYNESPLLLGNVWNVQSAFVFQNLGFEAIGTSSSAIAKSLGYEDGENISFEDYLFIIDRIIKSVNLPLSVDLEAGYGKTEEAIVSNITRLIKLGVAGINIEDSMVVNNKRSIQKANDFANKLYNITTELNNRNIELFINVRCDAFLLNLPDTLNEAIKRIRLYENAGIDGIFLPCITNETDIKKVVENTKLPLNVMCMPDLPDFKRLQELGVKRISMGNFVNGHIYKQMESGIKEIVSDKSFSSLF
jgi:2-methylisocitrate lyase-like PEP mutase family enzyme